MHQQERKLLYSRLNRKLYQSKENSEIEKTFALLKEGDEKIVLDDDYKSLIFVIGNTGSGKSTLIQFVAGDNSNLTSKEVGEGEFIVVDENEKIGEGINSQTLFPDLVVDKELNAPFYDCPGFNDSRSSSFDIATSYFIKKVFDFAEDVKICLSVNYSSVRTGVERTDFMNLMRHATTLIKDIDKYQNSVALFVTKVENQYVKEKKNGLVLLSDAKVIENVAKYLESVVKVGINEKLEIVKGDEKEEKFLRNALNLVDKLLVKDGEGKFMRIGIFRRPDEEGPLTEIELLQERKPAMKQLLHETLVFTKKNLEDFGYSISVESKKSINDLVEQINASVSGDVEKVFAVLKSYYQDAAEQTQSVFRSMNSNNEVDNNVDIDESLVRTLSTKLTSGFDAISTLGSKVADTKNIKIVADAIEACTTALQLDFDLTNILLQAKYFDFLQHVNGEPLNSRNWGKLFEATLTYVDAKEKDIKKDTVTMSEKMRDRVKLHLTNINKEMSAQYSTKFKSLEIGELTVEADKQHKILAEFLKGSDKIDCAQELSYLITNTVSKAAVDSSELNLSASAVFNYGKFLAVLNAFNKEISVWSPEWINELKEQEKYLNVSARWYGFLQRLYGKLAVYEMQQFREKYNVANIEDWGKPNKTPGIQITKANFKTFLAKVGEDDETVKTIDLDETKAQELDHVLELTIKQKSFTHMNSNGELVIQGAFVKFSDIVNQEGKLDPKLSNDKHVRVLNIFAMDTLFVDADFSAVGEKLQVNIVAPKWEIIGTRKINLDGKEGESQEQANAGSTPSGNGADGLPGLPGNPAGNFVGVGYEFKAIRSLTVTANGGRGGKGQRGGTGGKGANGEDAYRNSEKFWQEFIRDDKVITVLVNSIKTEYVFHGLEGGVGGKGGIGGASGLGAAAGSIAIIRTDGSTTTDLPTMKNVKGSDGDGGEGGSGGEGGKRGNNIRTWHHEMFNLVPPFHTSEWTKTPEVIENWDHAKSGDNGEQNSNSHGRQNPEKGFELNNMGEVLNDFELYLRDVLNDRFLKQALKRFLDHLHNSKNIYTNYVYDTATLAHNLSNLESQLVKLNNALTNDEIIYLYQSILQRTTDYSKHLKPAENTKDFKKAINYIYSAALSKVASRKMSFATALIIDVSKYLELALKNVNTLKDMSEKDNKLKVVNGYKEKFKKNVDSKITEAQGFIDSEIQPEIKGINEQIADQIDKLIKEVIKLEEAAEQEKEKLIESKRDLQLALFAKVLMGGIDIVGKFIGPIGSLGSIVSTALDITTTIGGPVIEGAGKVEVPEAIFSNITDIKGKIAKIKEEKKKEDQKPLKDFEDVYKKYAGETKKIATIDDAIKQADAKIKALQDYKKKVSEKVMPMLDDMEKQLDELSDQLKEKSQVGLDVSKYRVQSVLRDVKLQMKQMTKGYKVEDDLSRCIEKLEEAMTTQINIYDRIQSYQDQKTLAAYIADVSTGVNEDNPALSQALTTLEIMIRRNLVLQQHKRAVNALSQHVFPFAEYYLNENFLFSPNSDEDLESVATQTVKKLETLQGKIDVYKASIVKQDQHISSSLFDGDHDSVRPFFIWRNKTYRKFIAKLLNGEKVKLFTNVHRSERKKDAIKFNISEIAFRVPNNAELNAELIKALKHFKGNLTHSGDSYYRFKDRIYVIHCESQWIQHTLDRRADGSPTTFNGVYEKIRDGDLMLSPYAMWELQLTKAVEDNVDHFKDLQKFVDHADLELCGEGNFVSHDKVIPDLHVDQYYQPDSTIRAIE